MGFVPQLRGRRGRVRACGISPQAGYQLFSTSRRFPGLFKWVNNTELFFNALIMLHILAV